MNRSQPAESEVEGVEAVIQRKGQKKGLEVRKGQHGGDCKMGAGHQGQHRRGPGWIQALEIGLAAKQQELRFDLQNRRATKRSQADR